MLLLRFCVIIIYCALLTHDPYTKFGVSIGVFPTKISLLGIYNTSSFLRVSIGIFNTKYSLLGIYIHRPQASSWWPWVQVAGLIAQSLVCNTNARGYASTSRLKYRVPDHLRHTYPCAYRVVEFWDALLVKCVARFRNLFIIPGLNM